MTPATDPYRTLGLTRGASLDEIKRAYRKLAKENHPDAAGQGALPRFLAIQAAYDQLTGDVPSKAVPRPPSRPSSADPARTDATHRAYGGRTRRTRPSGSGSTTGTGPTGTGSRARSTGSSGPTGGAGPTGAGSTGGADATGTSGGRPKGKATLGSTSYDGADASQFEPDWGGASWYGTTSGTYWTINPKEYADPRKHGPEYQARARRAAAGRAGAPPPGETLASDGADAAGAGASTTIGEDPETAGSPPPPPPPEHTTSSWWRATAGPTEATQPPPPGHSARPTSGARWEHAATGSAAGPATPDLGAAAADLGRALTDERTAHGRWRFVQAIVGWLPLVLGIGWLIGEMTGCSRFAASCDGTTTGYLQPIVAVALLGLLLLVPRLAAVAAAGAVAVVVAAVPTALILSATGEAAEIEARATALGVTIVVAWLVGVGIAVARRMRLMPPRAGPVS
jgi:hypothetical protein